VGSVWALKVDDLELEEWKGKTPDTILSTFRERDKRVGSRLVELQDGSSEDWPTREYVVAANDMRERLNVGGFTSARARKDYLASLGHCAICPNAVAFVALSSSCDSSNSTLARSRVFSGSCDSVSICLWDFSRALSAAVAG